MSAAAAKSADYIAAEKKYGAPLVNNFTFYAAYHTNTVNKIIHVIVRGGCGSAPRGRVRAGGRRRARRASRAPRPHGTST
jgi:hypothetical protein